MGRLEDKRALITGGGAGLGAAIAQRFHEEGAEVLINDIHRDAAERVAKDLGGAAIVADVADSAAVRRMFDDVRQHYGRLDILVNNAGIGVDDEASAQRFNEVATAQAREMATAGKISTHWDFTVGLSDEYWQRMIAIHMNGTFYCSREALKIMNTQDSGVIINMGSIMGTTAAAGAVHYCAAKAGILGFTRSLAREVVTRNIRVNAIAPGWIETDMTAPLEGVRPYLELQTPMGRFGEPDDIAWAAVYLASDESKFVTGQVLSPNGGWYMSQ